MQLILQSTMLLGTNASYYLKYSFKQKKRVNNTDDLDKKRPFRKRQAIGDYRCLSCEKGQEKVSCIRFQHLMWTLITELQDTYFLVRIDRDFIAKEAKYHLKCPSSLKNHYRSYVRKLNQEEENICRAERRMIESRVFERSGQI